MTAWQDQPPLSSKNMGNKPLSRRQVRENERSEKADVPLDVAREGWDTEARRVAAENREQPPTGRRSQRPQQPAEQPVAEAAEQPAAQEPAPYKVRDFSPNSQTPFSSAAPGQAASEQAEPGQAEPENLVYRTQAADIPAMPVEPAPPIAQVPVFGTWADVSKPPVPLEERTMSRREMRALEASAAASAERPLVADPFAQLDTPEPPKLIEPALTQPELPMRRSRTRELATDLPTDLPAEATPALVEPAAWTPPTGHWSTQASIDDDQQFRENTLSRNIGATSGAITTNALVLPLMPVNDMTRPLGNTGEILITGIIDLPRSFGTTGAIPARYDHSDVDTLLEASDREDSEPSLDSAPVRAIRAVNTHTSTLGVMETKPTRDTSRLPLILGVVATTLAVGVVILVVAAMVFGVFK